MKTKEKPDYPFHRFDTWKCQICERLFQTHRDEPRPISCPYCDNKDYSQNTIEKYSERDTVQKRKQKLDEMKNHLETALGKLEDL